MRTILRILTVMVSTATLLTLSMVLIAKLTMKNGIFVPSPYINTEFVVGFSADEFGLVKVGMSRQEVEKLIGKPLLYSPLSRSNKSSGQLVAQYSKKRNIFFNLVSWRGYEITYGADHKVTGSHSAWWDESTS